MAIAIYRMLFRDSLRVARSAGSCWNLSQGIFSDEKSSHPDCEFTIRQMFRRGRLISVQYQRIRFEIWFAPEAIFHLLCSAEYAL